MPWEGKQFHAITQIEPGAPVTRSWDLCLWINVCCNAVGYTMDVIYFSALDHPVEVDGGIYMPGMALLDHAIVDCSQNYTAGTTNCLILFLDKHTLASLHFAAAKRTSINRIINKYVSKTHTCHTGMAELRLCATPPLPFRGQYFRRSSYDST